MKTLVFLIALLVATTLTAAAEAPSKAPPAKESKPAAAKTHWITNSSGIRHNSKCKYYENSKGRPCTKDEGRACKICGG